uniref:DDB1- and CUL4-associated factor 1 n=1 Tax=Oryzias sinensis TaxID=183150 RepID=A0A8C7X1R9_9TELE
MASAPTSVDSKAELTALLEQWEREQHGSTQELVNLLTKISELVEKETEEYHKADPDPFDDRHPGRADPECMLGHLLKILFKNDDFMNTLVNNYVMTSREFPLNAAACRLLQNIMPGLETAVVFQEKEGIVERLFKWAQEAEQPLRIYATGLLAGAMENQDIAANYREENSVLLLAVFMQMGACELLMHYMDLKQTNDVQLTFEALKYLASLLLHKKFAAEFVDNGGVQKLLEIPRPSMAATGVSLCLYYLAYNQDAMERVCMLPHSILSDVVAYTLWLLECSHASGCCHATMFFSISFSFRAVLELFDRQDGLRRLVNLISTLEILNPEDQGALLSDDEIFSSRQTAKHTCMALRRYFEAHLAIKVEQVKQSLQRTEGGAPIHSQPYYKAVSYSREQVVEMMEFLIEYGPLRLYWEPAEVFHKLSCVQLLLQLISIACEWRTYYGRSDTVRYALDILSILTVVPKTQILLCESIAVLDDGGATVSTVGMSIVLAVAEGEIFVNDAEIQKSALQVIINCVCAPDKRMCSIGKFIAGTPRRRLPQQSKSSENVLTKMWNVVQSNNGIKVLLSLLTVKMPITDADQIRALACKALVGLSRSTSVRQIISKLPLFSSGHIQQLMKEPVLQDKRSEHVKFCKFAAELIERISGKPLLIGTDVSLAWLQRASVVAQSRIAFPEKELLLLIRNHLLAKGLHDTATALTKEADLPMTCLSHTSHSTSAFPSVAPPPPASPVATIPRAPRLANGVGARLGNHPTHTPIQASSHPQSRPSTSQPVVCPSNVLPSTSASHCNSSSPLIGRIIFSRERQTTCGTMSCKKARVLRQKSDHGAFSQSPAMKKQFDRHLPSPPALDSIITEYLREQHARCKNPVATCPPFSLFTPHQCPEPKQRRQAPTNFTSRHTRRVIYPKYGGVDGGCFDRHLIFSRFTRMRADSCVVPFQLGSSSSTMCLQDGSLLLTSASWSYPLSALWGMKSVFIMKHSFLGDHYVEFSKLSQDRVIGTKEHVARIYDIQTGQVTLTLNNPDLANNYKKNCATFNPTDDLVLNDGVLWDVRTAQAIHKFDKFNMNISGVFHPNSLEVIINTEIWDLRTFHLLHTVPALDQCRIVFNNSGTVIYGAMLQADDEDEMMEMQMKSPFGSSFRTFNATDYKPIATIDVKRNIFDLCTDTKDCYLAVIENQDSVNTDTVCRLYEVGRQRLAEEEEEDEEDQEDDDQDEDDDDDDDSDDDVDTDPLIAELENENGGEDDDDDGNEALSPSDEEVARLLEDDGDVEEDDDEDEDEEDDDNEEDDSDNDDADLEGDNGEYK